MANEIQISAQDNSADAALYAVITLLCTGQHFNGAALENYSVSRWANYVLPLVLDSAGMFYQADFPALAPNGKYGVTIFQQAADAPAVSDTPLSAGVYIQIEAQSTANQVVQLAAADYTGSNPLYFVTNDVGSDLQWNGSTLEVFNVSNWALYAAPMALAGSFWVGSFPPVPDGDYNVIILEQLGSTPDAADTILSQGQLHYGPAQEKVASQMQIDALAMLKDLGEAIVYQEYDDANNLAGIHYIDAIVNRNPPSVVQEDGKVLADDVEICIANHWTRGRPKINKGRDRIVVSGRYGGLVKPHLVTTISSGDEGMWTLRVK